MNITNAAQFLHDDLISVCALNDKSVIFSDIIRTANNIALFQNEQDRLLNALPGKALKSIHCRLNQLQRDANRVTKYQSPFGQRFYEFLRDISPLLEGFESLLYSHRTTFFHRNGRRKSAQILKPGLLVLFDEIVKAMGSVRGSKHKAQIVLARYRCHVVHGVRRTDIDLESVRKVLESAKCNVGSSDHVPVYVFYQGYEPLVEFARIWKIGA